MSAVANDWFALGDNDKAARCAKQALAYAHSKEFRRLPVSRPVVLFAFFLD